MKKKSETPRSFNQKQGQALIKLARKVLMERFGRQMTAEETETIDKTLDTNKIDKETATFVTLYKDGQLRGCIGNLSATEPLLESVKRNAVNAAFHDYRFSPLSDDELDQVHLEVSVLTEPSPLEYQDSADLIAKLKPNIDGVIIRRGAARATFLPQVWEQLPEAEDFLTQLCLKAGLAADTWQNTKIEVLTYQVQRFDEKR